MPFGDGTGPVGAGPASGRGMGFCRGNNAPGYMTGGRGIGRGGFGRARGWRNRFFTTGQPFWGRTSYPVPEPQFDPAAEAGYLKNEADYLKKSLDAINQRLSDLEKKQD